MRHGYILLLCILGITVSIGPAATQADATGSAVTFDRVVHFTAPDGGDVEVAPGIYRVEPGGESQLRLTTQGGQPIHISATKTSHEATLFSPIAVSVMEEGQDDQIHLVLLFPDGQARDAVGSYSGVRSRALGSAVLHPVQLQAAINQTKAAPQQAAPAPPPSPAVVRVPAAKVGKVGAGVKTPSSVNLGPGKWINWTYLQVNHPELVAQILADVQADKRPRSFVAGLATPAELNEMLKTNWAAEAARLNTAKQVAVTTRGLSPAIIAPPSGMTSVPPNQRPPSPVQHEVSTAPLLLLPVPAQDLGAAYSGEHNVKSFHATAPADGYLEALLDIKDVRSKRFRIDQVVAYTGEFVNGAAQIYRTMNGGSYDDIQSKNASDPTKVSTAGYVVLDVKAGQRVNIVVAFEPHASIGPPVGRYDAPLQLTWHASSTGRTGFQTVPLRAYCNGIHFGLIAYAEQAYAITLTDRSVDYPVVLTNAGATPIAGSFAAPHLPPGVTMNPLSINIAPNSTQHTTLRFNVNGQGAQDGSNQDIAVAFNYGGGSRPVNLSISIYHPWIWWCSFRTNIADDGTPCEGQPEVPGVPSQYHGLLVEIDPAVGVRQLQLWIKDDGQWWWQIDCLNESPTLFASIGISKDFKVTLQFNANTMVQDTIDVHIGTGTPHQLYERLHIHPWISSNFLTAAQTGVALLIHD